MLGGVAPEAQALFHRQQDLADAEQADHRDQEVEAVEQFGEAEGQAQLPGHLSRPTAASAKPIIIEAMVLNGGSLLMPTKLQKARK